jgi:hypothetical protein
MCVRVCVDGVRANTCLSSPCLPEPPNLLNILIPTPRDASCIRFEPFMRKALADYISLLHHDYFKHEVPCPVPCPLYPVPCPPSPDMPPLASILRPPSFLWHYTISAP